MRQLAPGVLVIGRYEPSNFDAQEMGRYLTDVSVKRGLETSGYGYWWKSAWGDDKLSAELRSPNNHPEIVSYGTSTKWHRDNNSSDVGMVLWSNREQTEIKLPDETVIRPEPGDILLIRNLSVEHRTPPEVSSDRWFFRRHVKVPEWMEIAK
jgi:hypothetical protein